MATNCLVMSLHQGEKNPFLLNPVVQCLFEYLPFKDIKNCRFVCTTWNSVSAPFLRKRGKVVFLKSFRPASFMEYTESHLPAVLFTNFKFTHHKSLTRRHIRTSHWTVSEIQNFLTVYGSNIKFLEFDDLTIFQNDFHPILEWSSHLNEFIDLAPKIVHLKIVGSVFTTFVVSVYKLSSIKKINLKNCTVDLISNKSRITPLEICLHKVTFQVNGVKRDNEVSLHDFIDFSQCTEIFCHRSQKETKLMFDMSSIVAVNKFDINRHRFLNWSTSPAKINHIIFQDFYREIEGDIKMQIKKLTLRNSSFLNVLPRTIEELTLEEGIMYSHAPIDLPNLKHLTVCSETGLDEFFGLPLFKNCSVLSNLILEASSLLSNEPCVVINVSWIPPSVKRIKFTGLEKFSFGFDAVIDIDILDLDADKISDAQNLINKVRPKVLVCSAIRKVHCDDFIEFVQKNKQIEKVFLRFHNLDNVVSSVSQFEFLISNFSIHVDEDASVYEFDDGHGKAISEEQFERMRKWCSVLRNT